MPTNGMTIDSLNTVSSLTAHDEVPVWDKEASGEPTRKITAQNLTNSVKTLGSLVNTTEMNNAIAQSTADFQTVYSMEDKPTIQAGIESVIDALPNKIKNGMFMCWKGMLYTVIVQKYQSEDYASYIAISYAIDAPLYGKKLKGVWTHYNLQTTQITN